VSDGVFPPPYDDMHVAPPPYDDGMPYDDMHVPQHALPHRHMTTPLLLPHVWAGMMYVLVFPVHVQRRVIYSWRVPLLPGCSSGVFPGFILGFIFSTCYYPLFLFSLIILRFGSAILEVEQFISKKIIEMSHCHYGQSATGGGGCKEIVLQISIKNKFRYFLFIIIKKKFVPLRRNVFFSDSNQL
jgi:hypothetical protein